MKLIDALKKVIKSQENESCLYSSLCELANCYSINYCEFNTRLKSYWITTWRCTDTWVGISAIYLDNELVGYSTQFARKSDVNIKFISKELANKTISFIKSLEENNYAIEENIEQEIDDFYNVEYANQLIESNGFYESRKCKFIKTKQTGIISTDIDVLFEDCGVIHTIDVKDFKYKLRINE